VLKSSEVARSSYETIEQQKLQSVLQQALGLDSTDNALLTAGQQYSVSITWTCQLHRHQQLWADAADVLVPGR
jgi:hypothetical protein